MPRITMHAPTASGRRRGFHRHVTAVDSSRKDGYAFEGEFLPDGREVDLPDAAVLVRKSPSGSVKNARDEWAVGVVLPDGRTLWSEEYRREAFLTFRDAVEGTVNGDLSPIIDACEEAARWDERKADRADEEAEEKSGTPEGAQARWDAEAAREDAAGHWERAEAVRKLRRSPAAWTAPVWRPRTPGQPADELAAKTLTAIDAGDMGQARALLEDFATATEESQ